MNSESPRHRVIVAALLGLSVLCGASISSAQTVTIVEKVPSEIILGRDMANLVSLTNRPERLSSAEVQTAIDGVFALYAKRLPIAAAHGPESVRARALLQPQTTYDATWQAQAQRALADWRSAIFATWHPQTSKHIAAFYLGEDTQAINNNALSNHSAQVDSTYRTELEKLSQLDDLWLHLRDARRALIAAKVGDWNTIATRSSAMLAVLDDADNLYTPRNDTDP